MPDIDLSGLLPQAPPPPSIDVTVTPPPANDSPLQTDDFTVYDTVADGTLELKELSASGKLGEFLARFYATPTGSAAYFVSHFSRALTDHVKEDIVGKLESGDVDPELRSRLEYWAAHDFKIRAVSTWVRIPFYYQRINESMSFGGMTTDETTAAPWLGVSGGIHTQTDIGEWKWYNDFSAESDWQYGFYRAEENGMPTADGTEEGGYGYASVSSEAKLREQAAVNASVTLEGVANPLPETQQSSIAANGGASYAWELGEDKSFETKAGGSYIHSVDAPSVLDGLGQSSSYLHKSASGSFAYQAGGRGLIFSTTYYDIRMANDFDTLDMSLADGILTYRSNPWEKATLSLGAGGARSTYDSALTGLTTADGKLRLNASLLTPLGGGFSSETALSGGPSASSGSLSGWYGEIEKASQTFRFTKNQFSLGATVTANGYSRNLDYVDDSGASQGEEKQTQLGTSIGGNAAWAPNDAFSTNAGIKWGTTNQEGFQAVDSNTFSASFGTSLRLTGESAKRAAWLGIDATRSAETSEFGEDSYDHGETHAIASVTIK